MDYKFSIVVSCYDEPYETVKRCFDSVLDQDYKNWEIIFVPNGQWTGKNALIKRLKKEYPMIKLVSLKEKGLPNARNKGCEAATGDIFCCLGADYALHPGTLRTWQIEFTKHPECGIVYSGYRYFPDQEKDVYPSEEFDPYKLECFPYIDGGSPVRREVNKPCDPALASLIDYDWVLSIVRSGVKAHYIPEPMYSADIPKPGGLSFDSHQNWLNRTEQIKAKHGIPTRDVVCTSLLDPDEALRIAKLIGADFHTFPGHKPNRYKVVYCYGFSTSDAMLPYQAAMMSGDVTHTHKIIHWVGLDVRMLVRRPWAEVEALTKGVFVNMKEHWTIGKRDQQILDEMFKGTNINVKNVYPPTEPPRKGKLQDTVYISDRELLEQINKAMPDINLTNTKDDGIPRISVHFQDKPANIIRAAAEGSYVISEHLLPYTGELICDNIPSIRKQIVHTIRKLNKEGVEKDKATIKYYTGQTYFKQKIEKYRQIPIRTRGRLMDIMDTYSEEKLEAV